MTRALRAGLRHPCAPRLTRGLSHRKRGRCLHAESTMRGRHDERQRRGGRDRRRIRRRDGGQQAGEARRRVGDRHQSASRVRRADPSAPARDRLRRRDRGLRQGHGQERPAGGRHRDPDLRCRAPGVAGRRRHRLLRLPRLRGGQRCRRSRRARSGGVRLPGVGPRRGGTTAVGAGRGARVGSGDRGRGGPDRPGDRRRAGGDGPQGHPGLRRRTRPLPARPRPPPGRAPARQAGCDRPRAPRRAPKRFGRRCGRAWRGSSKACRSCRRT